MSRVSPGLAYAGPPSTRRRNDSWCEERVGGKVRSNWWFSCRSGQCGPWQMRNSLPVHWFPFLKHIAPCLAIRCADASGAYIEDYDSVCPDSWAEDEDHFCVSPDTYVGPCVGRKRFGLTLAAELLILFGALQFFAVQCCRKSSMGRCITGCVANDHSFLREGATCGVSWPQRAPPPRAGLVQVKRACVANMTTACPEQWAAVGTQCHAPTNYKARSASLISA